MNRLDYTLGALRRAPDAAAWPPISRRATLIRKLRWRCCVPAGGRRDVIELGMPFSDPVADGPILQQANARALAGGRP